MEKLETIVTGTGRCGTAYAAKLLTEAGLNCTHEEVWGFHVADWEQPQAPAEASWVAAPFLQGPFARDAQVIHLVRHPKHVIESLIKTGFFDDNEERTDWSYTQFAYDNLPALLEIDDPVDRAAFFYVEWNRMIERRRPDAIRVPVEAAHPVWEQVPNPEWCVGADGTPSGQRHLIKGDPGKLLGALGIAAPETVTVTSRENRHPGSWGKIPLSTIPDPGIRGRVQEMCLEYGYAFDLGDTPRVFWSLLLERAVQWTAIDAIFDLVNEAAKQGQTRISVPYTRTDIARNNIVRCFLELAQSPDDMVVMLDCDHLHPPDTVARLFQQSPEYGVVAALAFRRGPPYDPMFFIWEEGEERFAAPAEWERGALYECDAIATCAMGIRQWAFMELDKAGHPFPYFRYSYSKGGYRMTEDIYFAWDCMDAGVSQYCDTGLVVPHLSTIGVDEETWEDYKRGHPEILSTATGKES